MSQTTSSSLNLPAPIANYFAQDALGAGAVSECFSHDAVVRDEGHTYEGRPAIKAWKANASAKYQYTSQPFSCERAEDDIIVTSRVSGNFPGSPIDLRYAFQLKGDLITSLTIPA